MKTILSLIPEEFHFRVRMWVICDRGFWFSSGVAVAVFATYGFIKVFNICGA